MEQGHQAQVHVKEHGQQPGDPEGDQPLGMVRGRAHAICSGTSLQCEAGGLNLLRDGSPLPMGCRDHGAIRFQGMAASRRAMPQKPVMPEKVRPAPTIQVSRIQPGATLLLRTRPSRLSEPAAICT